MKSVLVRRVEVVVGLILVGQSVCQKITRKNVVCGETLLHPLVSRPTIFTLAVGLLQSCFAADIRPKCSGYLSSPLEPDNSAQMRKVTGIGAE